MRKKNLLTVLAATACAIPSMLLADSITPTAVTATLEVGQSVTVRKTVTVNTSAPTTTKVDVFFLADTTGSMSPYLTEVRNAAASILSSAAGLGDVAFGVGNYQDFPTAPYGGPTDYAYRLDSAVTTSSSDAQAAINTWTAGWGYDGPESQLAALQGLANVGGSTTGWRAGSERILVWFGDAPGHDGALEPGYPGPSEAAATSALLAQGIQVQALNVGYGGLDDYGQATRITTATGGVLYNGIDTAGIVAAINNAITTAFSTYRTVGIDTTEVPAGVDVSVNPVDITGSFDRSVARTFAFDVTFTGETAGAYDFALYGTVDGGRVATESDSITVTDTSVPGVPDGGATLLLMGLALVGMASMRRR